MIRNISLKKTLIYFLLLGCAEISSIKAFTIHSHQGYKPVAKSKVNLQFASISLESQQQQKSKRFQELRALPKEQNNAENSAFSLSDIQINPPYLIAWVSLLSFAFFFTPEPLVGGENSQRLLDAFIANAVHPENVNELFIWVFSLFTFIPIVLASLIMPGARGQTLPATPFLIGASALGYFPLGIYMSTRKEVTEVNKSDFGWFTSNILENKTFHLFNFVLAVSTLVSTGVVSSLINDFSATTGGFVDLVSTATFASVSTVDLSLLTICAASIIPEDLKRRGINDEQKANLIAASTLLLPVIGGCLYCALRPELPSEE